MAGETLFNPLMSLFIAEEADALKREMTYPRSTSFL